LTARLVPSDAASRAALLSLVSNFLLMVVKIAAGLITGSVAVLSDGIDSVQDLFASSITFAGVRYGRRPPDIEHPYGHGRAETLAAGAQGMLIAASGVFIGWQATMRLMEPQSSIDTGLGIVVILASAAVNLFVLGYVAATARRTQSPAIASDARHIVTNVVQAGAIGLALLAVRLTG
jgi:cation diffusion facilitator family transporter